MDRFNEVVKKAITNGQGTYVRTHVPIQDIITPEPVPFNGEWAATEQLYPESRGYLVHTFKTNEECEDFIATGMLISPVVVT